MTRLRQTSQVQGELQIGMAMLLGSRRGFLVQPDSSNNDLMNGASEIAQELMSFSQTRLQADLNGWKALVACRSPGDLFECQRHFVKEITVQYTDQFNKFTSRVTRLMGNSVGTSEREETAKH